MSQSSDIRDTMNHNTFSIIAGIVGLIEVGLFWMSAVFRNPFFIIIDVVPLHQLQDLLCPPEVRSVRIA
jgi:hypothetical protein